MEKFLEYMQEAEKKLALASHMTYVTYPIIKEKRLLLKILSEINDSVASMINPILQKEAMFNKVKLFRDPNSNLRLFSQKASLNYDLSQEEVKILLSIIELNQKHKKSPFEFIRNDKIVIMLDDLKIETITLEKIKEFLVVVKNVSIKVKNRLNSD